MRRRTEPTGRGQAYTLEGFLGAIILLSAMLLAQQALVLSPTTAGGPDADVRNQLHLEANDAVLIAGDSGDLYDVIRSWDPDEQAFEAETESVSRGVYNTRDFGNVSILGQMLYQRFEGIGWQYNVRLTQPGEDVSEDLIYQGSPTAGGVAATYSVTVYEHTVLADGRTVAEVDEDDFPFEPTDGLEDSPAYAIVDVEVILWPTA